MLSRVVGFIVSTMLIWTVINLPNGGHTKKMTLFLTPYIESNRIDAGRKMAHVTGLNWSAKSYSGLLTVNKTLGSNMFFWFFPSESKPDKVPLLLWLNGFSTASSYGLFLQNGPYDLLNGDKLKHRSTSWQKYFNVLYIDNPVGVGFSFTRSEEGYSRDFDSIANNLHSALKQFLKLFPSLARRELYLTGLSLAGKYIPPLAYSIYKENVLNLKGLFIGNPLMDPMTQIQYSEYLTQLGFIDMKIKSDMERQEKSLQDILTKRDYTTYYNDALAFVVNDNSYLTNVTGLKSVYDYNAPYIDPQYYFKYIGKQDVRDALHVSGISFNQGDKAMGFAANIFSQSVIPMLQEMVETTPILIYVGQMDIICAYPMLAETLSAMNWSGKAAYNNADREKLRDGSYVWGYEKTYKTLTEVLVRKASHSAITNQPNYILNLIFKFTNY